MEPVVSLDIGGSLARAALVVGAEARAYAQAAWPPGLTPAEEAGFAATLARRVVPAEGATPPRAVGVALAALTDRAGRVAAWPNRPQWQGLPFGAMLEAELGLPVVIEDDANAAAVGEWIYGAGRGYRHVAVMMVGTGIGAGIILDGRLVRGTHGWAGEAGHITLAPDGPRCVCGRAGCLQALASGRALDQLAARHGLADAAALAAAAANGDPWAVAAVRAHGAWLGVAAATLVNLLDLEAVVIGGGLSRLGALWWQAVADALRDHTLYADQRNVALHRATLAQSGILGAACLARRQCAGRRPSPAVYSTGGADLSLAHSQFTAAGYPGDIHRPDATQVEEMP